MEKTFAHQRVDRPLLDLGSNLNTTIAREAYDQLASYLDMPESAHGRLINRGFQVVEPAESVLQRLHIDTRALYPELSDVTMLDNGCYRDEWCITYRPAYSKGKLLYYDAIHSPLESGNIEELDRFPWPDTGNRKPYENLRRRGKQLRKETNFVLVGHSGDTSIFENARDLRGMAEWFMDLVRSKEYAHALMDKVCKLQCARMESYLSVVGDLIDVVCVADDISGQDRPLISHATYDELIKPYHEKYFQTIHKNTDAKLLLHSCGAVSIFLDDFVELGVDAINPVQVSAKGMDPSNLKNQYGEKLVFWGGVDTQRLLPYGTEDEVRQEVRRLAKVLGRDGGYVLGAVHNIQNGVPPENIVAMFDEAYSLEKT